jgi:hypothetical protein
MNSNDNNPYIVQLLDSLSPPLTAVALSQSLDHDQKDSWYNNVSSLDSPIFSSKLVAFTNYVEGRRWLSSDDDSLRWW